MQIQEVYDLITEDLAKVELENKKHLDSDVYLVRKVGEHLLASGGKRFRPSILLLTAKMCTYAGTDHIPLASVVEFIHTATLLHDDVIDDAKLRRGAASANTVWGNQASILVGDFLFSKSFSLMVESGNMDILRVLSSTTVKMAEGEIQQLLKNSDIETIEEEYLSIVINKTAVLISASCEVSGILANVSEEKRKALAGYGMNLGIAFQLMDDCLDYTSRDEELGKAVGNDLKEGKVTIPLIYTLERATEAEKRTILNAIETEELDKEQLSSVVKLIAKHKAIECATDTARQYIETAKNHIEVFEPNIEKAALLAIADYVLVRSF